MNLIMLPSDQGFQEMLSVPPPNKGQTDFVVRVQGHLMEAVNISELREYLEGGEYEERMEELDEGSLLYLPDEIEWDD